ncbi:MAG: 4-hydroxy-tetrahydrodipicolinate reductase [Prevotellaceae bacterium]|jgi:4-hydroxy-tetrahydrodipicolinate reductase|nr:4-hydroxy-tetrahydrodipicolinate reductase [Prevotellaceae bacterium]
MKIALIGYGKMGQFIERIAKERGHEIVSIIDINNKEDFDSDAFRSADVAIEFTRPESAVGNIRQCFAQGVPVVCGTTGWVSEKKTIKKEMEAANATLFWASNFSIGVNIFFELNKQLAKMMDKFAEYNVEMTEIHHIHKLDAPSGTAITLAEGMLENLSRKTQWTNEVENASTDIAIKAVREGEVPGTHIVKYESAVDNITISHEAYTRQGLALGAVVAAEFTAGKKGFLTMADLMKF